MRPILILLALASVFAAEDVVKPKDLKKLGTERTEVYTAALKLWSGDKLILKLIEEEKIFAEKAKEAEATGNKDLAVLLNKAKNGKHMEKRYYLRLLDPEFNRACQAFDDADPGFIGTKTSKP